MSVPAREATASKSPRPPHRPRTSDLLPGGGGGAPVDGAALAAARELRRRWQAGDRVAAEAVLAQHPELSNHPKAAVEIVYEEFCLREAAGELGVDVERELLRRFPQWSSALRVMLDCHRRVLADYEPQFPGVGDRVGAFRLAAELGRGARGRVFLARQTDLADRAVVLKLVPLDEGAGHGEHLSLARLQHTNIVPLYSAFDDAERRLRVLCMPYFGRATLASALASLADVPPAERTGRQLVAAIDDPADADGNASTTAAAARQMLERASYVQAVCWAGACLADALHFAHERGLVHLDLKPSNVLLSSDGQPMLLDFHLARGPLQPGAADPPDNFGGTPPYMPPEQRAAMAALREGRPVEAPVDRRADVYALGAILYEALAGAAPADSGGRARPLSAANARVTPGLSDVVAKCLSADPKDRYGDALALADDLRRHLTDQPLFGVRNRSFAERWRKWRRRRPGALRVATLLAAAAAVVFAVAWHVRDRLGQAELALRDGQRRMQPGGDPREAALTFDRGLDRLQGVPLVGGGLRTELRHHLMVARRAELARQVHELADAVRMQAGVDAVPTERLRPLAIQCEALWRRRAEVVEALGGPPVGADAAADLTDVAVFAADLRVRLAPPTDTEAARSAAREILTQARDAFGPSVVVDQYARALLGTPGPNGIDHAPSHSRAPRTAADHCALARAYLASGQLAPASRELNEALRLEPAGRWPNFYAGVCAYRAGRYDDAVSAFSTCIGAVPDSAGCYHNRASAYAALGRLDDARRDYATAAALRGSSGDPAGAEAARRLDEPSPANGK